MTRELGRLINCYVGATRFGWRSRPSRRRVDGPSVFFQWSQARRLGQLLFRPWSEVHRLARLASKLLVGRVQLDGFYSIYFLVLTKDGGFCPFWTREG